MEQLTNWHSLPISDALSKLTVDSENGLDEAEAKRRLEQYGPNELREEPRPGFLARLLRQFQDMIVLLLIAASIISAVLGEWYEAAAIIAIVILNAALGVIQEGRAEQALAALKKMTAPEAHVVREGKVKTIAGGEVVPGDIVLLEAGNYVPADVRLVETANTQIDESSLTGESVPVTKRSEATIKEDASLGDRKTMGYKSTILTYGRGKGVVVGTGMGTEIGKIAEMIQAVEEEATPLQQRLDQLGRYLAYGALAITALVFVIIFWRSQQSGVPIEEAALDAFLIAVSLAIAAVPEGLPAVVTINLAIGMREMIKRNALIRRLPAVETLGSASAIASDKTGTLTQNEMTAVRLYVPESTVDVTGEGYTPVGSFRNNGNEVPANDIPDLVHLLRAGALASDARIQASDEGGIQKHGIVGDPTEGAIVVAAAKADLDLAQLAETYPRIDELPFDSSRKRMSTLHVMPDDDDEDYVLYVKGAPDFILELCTHIYDDGDIKPLTDASKTRIANVNRDMAQDALRVLAVAQRRFEEQPEELSVEEHEKDLTFLGLIGMIDPARPEVAPAIARARHAGIKTVMVTGDYAETARAIAKQIGLIEGDERVVTGAELETMNQSDLDKQLDDVSVFARVSPEHKVRIVEAFRNRNYVVAMTGDGVNDAPALKRASIGVAMGITGTDVSKETADMVLTDDNYVSIVNAVEQGRIIYDNIRKFVYFLLSCNLAEIATIFVATLAGFPSPLTAIQLLWVNLLTDGAPALALGVEKGDPDVMDRPPRPPDEPIIDRIMQIGSIVQTVFITAVTLFGFIWAFNRPDMSLEEARTIAFVTLAGSQLARAYTSRSEYFSVFKMGVFSNKYMQWAVLGSAVLLVAVVYVPFLGTIFETFPLTLRDWSLIIPLTFIPAIAAEITKIFLRAAFKHPSEVLAEAAAAGD